MGLGEGNNLGQFQAVRDSRSFASPLGISCALIAIAVLALLGPAGASAAGCTDTWIGPAEGNWLTPESWSSEAVPGEADVACIPSGKTVRVYPAAGRVGMVQGEGTLEMEDRLELMATGEASVLNTLILKAGANLSGPGTLEISNHLTWAGNEYAASMSGSGTTVIWPGATVTGTPKYVAELRERTFINEGTFALQNGTLGGLEGAEFINQGTFDVSTSAESAIYGTFLNQGSFEKTEGSGLVYVDASFNNQGTVDSQAGNLYFREGGSSGAAATWTAQEGARLSFNGNSPFAFHEGSISGSVKLISAEMDFENTNLEAANIEQEGGRIEVTGTTTTRTLAMDVGAQLAGPGTLEISEHLTWAGGPCEVVMLGSGTTVIAPGATVWAVAKYNARLDERTFINEGTFDLKSGDLFEESGAGFFNRGTFNVTTGAETAISGSEAETFVNAGTFEKTEGSGTQTVEPSFANSGVIDEQTGHFKFLHPITAAATQHYSKECHAGDPVNCATGDFTESQTDFAIGGLGVGVSLTRIYSAQAAATAGSPGAFGYGWTAPFSDHLASEEEGERITLFGSDGSTVPFTTTGEGAFIAPPWTEDTLSGSPEAGYTLTLPEETKYGFSGAGRLETVTDRNGNETMLGYDGSGRLETITDQAGRRITFTYNGGGQVESAEDPMGHVVSYGYEGGRLTSVTMPGEAEPRWRFEYDGSRRITKVVDGRGGQTLNEYDGSNRVISQTDPAERTTTFEYAPFDTVITNTATGSVTDERFTSNHEPYSITRGYGTPEAVTETFSYDNAGLLTVRRDGNGHKTTYGYDVHGNRTSEKDAAGDETRWTYSEVHQVLTETAPSGEKTTIIRDAHGNPETVSRLAPESKTQTVSYEYGPLGELKSMIDPLAHVWNYEYDSFGDLKAEIDPEGDKRSWVYDEDSRVTSTVSPRGNEEGAESAKFTTSIERDLQGRPLKITDPLEGTTEYAYDATGNLESITDPNGRKTKFTYDADNERTGVERPNGAVEETEYDGAGQVTSQIDGNKDKTTYVRNVLEQPVEVIDPLERKTTQSVDAAGNLKTKVDPDGRTTTYSYDGANRLTEISYSDGITPKATFGYDEDGNLTSLSDGTGGSSFEYDQLDRLVHSKDGNGDTMSWEYNLGNEPVGLTYPKGKSISRLYDKAGRLESLTDWLGHTTSFGYNKDSELSRTTFPSGTSNLDEYAFDRADRMSAVTMTKGAEALASLSYARDKAGQVESLISKGLPGAEEESFTYDENERLKSASGGSYEYDSANNLTKAPGTTNAFDKASQLESAAGATFSYDKEGERTKRTPSTGSATTYKYDQAGNLTAVERAEEGEMPAIAESFAYDGSGLLASRTVGLSTRHFVWDLTEWPSPLLSDGENSYLYGPGGLAVEQISSEEVPTYLHHDQLGSTRLLTNSAGEASGSSTFAPSGAVGGKSGVASSPLGYAGQYTMGQSGLTYLRARFYDPATAQFMSRDPIENITRSAYGYAGENPLARIDPSGLCGVSSVGDIFESINPISEENCAYQAANSVSGTVSGVSLPSAREAAEAEVGFFDGGTAGLTKYTRDLLGIGSGGLALCGSTYDDFGIAGAATFSVLAPELGEGALQVASRFPRVSRWLVEHGDEATRIKDLAEEVIRHIVGK